MELIKEDEDNLAAFLRIFKHAENNPELKKKMEEAQRLYGTLTDEDLRKVFTI